MSVTSLGIIIVANTIKKKILLNLERNRAKAKAAKEQEIRFPITLLVVMMRVFIKKVLKSAKHNAVLEQNIAGPK